MFCPRCNRRYEAKDSYCGKCGSRLVELSPSTAAAPPGTRENHGGPAGRPVKQAAALSKQFYLWSIGGGYGGMFLLYIIGYALIFAGEIQYNELLVIFGSLFVLSGLLPLFYTVVVSMLFVYRMWEAIQDDRARTTPGKAVGFLFIPFYNFYWIFQAFWGFARDFNELIRRRGLDISLLPEGLFLAYPILVLAAIVPFIGIFFSIAAVILFLCLVSVVCNAVNALHAETG